VAGRGGPSRLKGQKSALGSQITDVQSRGVGERDKNIHGKKDNKRGLRWTSMDIGKRRGESRPIKVGCSLEIGRHRVSPNIQKKINCSAREETLDRDR